MKTTIKMRTGILRLLSLAFLVLSFAPAVSAQEEQSVARQWNEQLLEAIRRDFARPVVHARNLYHISAAMYDAWSLTTEKGRPCLMTSTQGEFVLPIDQWQIPIFEDTDAAAREAVSYAAFRLLIYRYQGSPRGGDILEDAFDLMNELGYDPTYNGTDYKGGTAADLGNYIAAQIIDFGKQDGSNERGDYANVDYPDPINPALQFTNPFSAFRILDPNRWQSLQFPGTVIDQSGNVLGNAILPFLGAEWGKVRPFALGEEDMTMPQAGVQFGNSPIYHDPGPPPRWSSAGGEDFDMYRWGFEMVVKWSAHLDPTDGVMYDISPGARGNFQGDYPTDFADYPEFYKEHEGGTFGANGHPLNPVTGEPYPPNVVPRGDYTRVLAEFWADGPASETPPGHWFTIMNKVMDHPLFDRRFAGEGPLLDSLEYDVKAYLVLGGAMHDAAITAWSIKGAYDYIRPVSAIRWLAKNGQASVTTDPNYNQFGMKYDSGYIERITDFSELENNTTLALVKARSWIGPDAIDDPATDVAGVGWINPTMWYPYQRPTFVTPNFAGYVSGHSTYSSAAATVLEKLTGTPYFPGGVGEFVAEKDSFLVFEKGPSVDVVLQWATYRDASDQTSLSRIWGGIHPPADDVPGRIIGIDIGDDAFALASDIFSDNVSSVPTVPSAVRIKAFPNPVQRGTAVRLDLPAESLGVDLKIYDATGRQVHQLRSQGRSTNVSTDNLVSGLYFLRSVDGRFGSVLQVF